MTNFIERYFSDRILDNIKRDFEFLIQKVNKSNQEYDLQIRKNYFNLYYRGNSIAKVECNGKEPSHEYKITIHNKFINENKYIIKPKTQGKHKVFMIPPEQLESFFSSENLQAICARVKEVRFKEELVIEQMIIADNPPTKNLIIIDRQVIMHGSKPRIDLLALQRTDNERYRFVILEVKLGNNPELKRKVINQTKKYIELIRGNFETFKKCYQTNYKQKKELGLFEDKELSDTIEIVDDTKCVIIISGYLGIAQNYINRLKEQSIEVVCITHNLKGKLPI